jgi:hypothetical protein
MTFGYKHTFPYSVNNITGFADILWRRLSPTSVGQF